MHRPSSVLGAVPAWSDLFGSPDGKEADPGRALTAPAAYLADLLQLLEDRFDPTEFHARRPDIARIPLNGEQSFGLVRQLDIVNRVMSDRIEKLTQSSVDEVLAASERPFSLPYEHQHERVRQLLALLHTSYRELYTSLAKQPDTDMLARERLGLSPARAVLLVNDQSANLAQLRVVYGLAENERLADSFLSRTIPSGDASRWP